MPAVSPATGSPWPLLLRSLALVCLLLGACVGPGLEPPGRESAGDADEPSIGPSDDGSTFGNSSPTTPTVTGGAGATPDPSMGGDRTNTMDAATGDVPDAGPDVGDEDDAGR